MSRMSLVGLALGISVVAGLGAVSADSSQPANPTEREKQLAQHVGDLASQLAQLRQENAQLKAENQLLRARLAMVAQVNRQRAPASVPDNWTPRQFNGMTFYLVPLDAGRPAATQPVHP